MSERAPRYWRENEVRYRLPIHENEDGKKSIVNRPHWQNATNIEVKQESNGHVGAVKVTVYETDPASTTVSSSQKEVSMSSK